MSTFIGVHHTFKSPKLKTRNVAIKQHRLSPALNFTKNWNFRNQLGVSDKTILKCFHSLVIFKFPDTFLGSQYMHRIGRIETFRSNRADSCHYSAKTFLGKVEWTECQEQTLSFTS